MGRRPGWRGWRAGLGRGLSLRARLLIGLIALTAVFLVVMGVVSTLALSTLEQDDLDSSLKLLVQQRRRTEPGE